MASRIAFTPFLVLLVVLLLVGCAEPARHDPAAVTALPWVQAARPADLTSRTVLAQVYVRLQGPSAAGMIHPGEDPTAPHVERRVRRRLQELTLLHRQTRALLEARGAVFVASLTRLANALHVRVPQAELAHIERLPHVVAVEAVPRWRSTLGLTLDVIGAPEAWGTTPYHGEGMRIAIVDSGIDYTHADFGGSGTPTAYSGNDSKVLEPGSFPTERVVAGWDLAGDAYNPDAGIELPEPDDDPLDCGGHGTLVAGVASGSGVVAAGGTYGGSYDQSLDLQSFRVAPGVAPEAELYAIKVFGCDGPTSLVAGALEIAADPNGDGRFDDRLDVVNLSLGSDFGYHAVTDAEQMTNLVNLGVVVVAAAGNAGQVYYAAGAPGALPEPIAAGGVAGVSMTLRVDSPRAIAADYAALEGSFSEPLANTGPVAGALVRADPSDACTTLVNAAALDGKVALVDRGDCAFVDKFQRVAGAGAVAVVVANDEPGLIEMGGDGSSPLPGVMIGQADAALIATQLAAGVDVTLLPQVFLSGLPPWPTSSRGPSAVGNILRPDVAAPGSAVHTAEVGTGNDGRPASGTSFSTPFVAGAAALLRQAEPTLTPHQVKAAMIASAKPLLLGGEDAPVSWQGAGRIDVPAMLDRQVTAAVAGDDGEVSVSFGAVVTDVSYSAEREVVLSNRSDAAVSYIVSLAPGQVPAGVAFDAQPTSLTVPAGGEAKLMVSMTVEPEQLGAPGLDPGTPAIQFDLPRHHINEAWGRLRLDASSGDQSLTLPVHAVVRAAASRQGNSAAGCASASGQTFAVSLDGASAHPEPVVSAFQLAARDDEEPGSADDPKFAALDLRAVGVASNAATSDDFDEMQIHFGVAIQGEWSTPASSSLAIEVDADADGAADTVTVLLPLSLEGPFADAFVSVTYAYAACDNALNLRSCGAGSAPLYANMVSAEELDTQPFLNSVIVISLRAVDVGLSNDDETVRFRAVSFEQTEPWPLPFDDTEWLTFDYANPGLDTALNAPNPGDPLFPDGEEVEVAVGASATSPELLLLHHTNVAGERWQILDPAGFFASPLALAGDLPAMGARGTTVDYQLSFENQGDHVLRDAHVEVLLDGAAIGAATSTQGNCTLEPLRCELGDVEPGVGGSLTLTLTLGEATEATVSATSSALGDCQAQHDTSMSVTDDAAASLVVHGGCGCEQPGRPVQRPWGLALGLLLAALTAQRRRRSACGRATSMRW